jgi:hypothetical protein
MNDEFRKIKERTWREIYADVTDRFLSDELKCIAGHMSDLSVREKLVRQEIMKRGANHE